MHGGDGVCGGGRLCPALGPEGGKDDSDGSDDRNDGDLKCKVRL